MLDEEEIKGKQTDRRPAFLGMEKFSRGVIQT